MAVLIASKIYIRRCSNRFTAFFISKFMKYLPYLLIAVLAFCLGWCSRSPSKVNIGKADTVTSVHVVTKVDVDTQYILSPQPYLATPAIICVNTRSTRTATTTQKLAVYSLGLTRFGFIQRRYMKQGMSIGILSVSLNDGGLVCQPDMV